MTLVVLSVCFLICTVGALGVASPSRLVGVVRKFQTPKGLYFAAAIRVVLGVALYFTAPTSRAPEVIRILGVAIIAVGLITPFFGVERFRRLLDWWSAMGPSFIRAWGFLALTLGLLLAYAVSP